MSTGFADNRITLHGIILKHRPVGDYDWLVTLLTAERGKINAFARAARRPSGRLSGKAEPFCFGSFLLYPGRDSYTLQEAQIDVYFESFRKDLERSAYGTFFLELADYYTRENIEAADYLNLLYLSLRALESEAPGLKKKLVRCVYELRAMVTEGIFPGKDLAGAQSAPVRQALAHIETAPFGRLYTFTLTDEALQELAAVTESLRRRLIDRKLLSLDLLTMYE